MMEGLSTALTDFATVFADVSATILGDNVLMIFLAGGLITMGFRVFKRAKKAVR